MAFFTSTDFADYQKLLNSKRIRGLILCSDLNQFLAFNEYLISQSDKILDISPLSSKEERTSINKIDAYLGQEYEAIFFDASKQFDVNLFTALSGTIVAGGLLVLKLPNICEKTIEQVIVNQWNENAIQQAIQEIESLPISSCLKRFVSESFRSTMTIAVSKNNHYLNTDALKKIIATDELSHAINEQQKIVDDLCRVATGHAKRPVVLIANRGRGKSTALALTVNQLLKDQNLSIAITAPNNANLKSFYQHLSITSDTKKSNDKASNIEFLPIDKLILTDKSFNLILVDEAAAIPVQLLEKLIQKYNRIIFSTTSHGYEGNGKGFEIRFKEKLLQAMPQTKFRYLEYPMRWSNYDFLEPIIFKAFILNNELKPIENIPSFKTTDEDFKILSKKELYNNKTLLKDIFSLLINAHYQTRPADLEYILDEASMQVAVTMTANKVIAVALINNEGQLDNQLCEAISSGRKRVKGQLLPQSIMLHSPHSLIGNQKFLRIMRIATHSDLQNKGVGSRLLKNIYLHAKKNQYDFLGTSFSTEDLVINFWFKNEYSIIRFGTSKDSSSGSHSCEMLLPISEKSQFFTNLLKENFKHSFLYKVQRNNLALNANSVKMVFTHQITLDKKELTNHDISELKAFCDNRRGYADIDWILFDLLRIILNKSKFLPLKNDHLSTRQIYFLIDKTIKSVSEDQLKRDYKLKGKKEVLQQTRELTRHLLSFI